ncbi:MAG TPA: hypothetical protein ENK62_09380 [Chromatiales bacterium]|nr:hypothetical protein [Chromatiales bacterium]
MSAWALMTERQARRALERMSRAGLTLFSLYRPGRPGHGSTIAIINGERAEAAIRRWEAIHATQAHTSEHPTHRA